MLVLVLDYPGRRAEARLSNLDLAGEGFAVCDLLSPPFPRSPRGPDYADQLLRRVEAPLADVTAVVAYCMAAPIAQEVAGRCGAGRDPVPLVLVDGEPSSLEAVQEQFGVSATQFAQQFAGAEVGGVAAGVDWSLLGRRPDLLVGQLQRALTDLGVRCLREDGADEREAADIAEEMAEFYLDWLIHLVASYHASWPAWGGRVHHAVSRLHGFRGAWPGAGSTVVREVDSERNTLIDHPDTREFVLGSLRGSLPPRS